MSESLSLSSLEQPTSGRPHDLLARLYREIGVSAVAAALETIGEPEVFETAESAAEEAIPAQETRAA